MASLRRERSNAKVNRKKGDGSETVAPFLRSYAEWKGYVNVHVGETEKGRFSAFVNDADLVREVTAEVLYRGYKVSFVQTDEDGTIKATAYQGFAGCADSGLSVSAWAGEPWIAVASVVFLVAMVAQFDLSKFESFKRIERNHTF